MYKHKGMQIVIGMVLVAMLLSACAPATPEATEAPAEPTEAPAEPTEAPAEPTEAPPEPTPEPIEERGTLRLTHDMQAHGGGSFDPASPIRFQPAIYFIYDRLVGLDENGSPVPELATSWEPDATAEKWTFKLREGVTFHDGKPFTSADVVYTFKHIFDPELESAVAAALGIVDAEALETPDDLTVVFNLKSGHADFPLLLVDYRVRMIREGSLDTIEENPIGTGPYTLEKFDLDGTTVFVANDDYWAGRPGLAVIEAISMADSEARVQALLADQIDFGEDTSPDQLTMFEDDPNYVIREVPSGYWHNFVMNVTVPPFDDIRVRQAMKLVVDRQEIIDVLLQGHGSMAYDHPVWPGDPYFLELDLPQDIEKAKELLDEAGHPDGLTVELYVSDLDSLMIPIAIVYKEQAAEAGINVEIKQVPADGFWDQVWMVQPFTGSHWGQRPADQILNEAFRCEASWNETFWCDEEFEQLLDDARKELDLAKRTELYQSAQQLIADEGGEIVFLFKNEISVMNVRVKGMPLDKFDYENIPWYKIYIEEQ